MSYQIVPGAGLGGARQGLSGLDPVFPWQGTKCPSPSGEMSQQQSQALLQCRTTEQHDRMTGWMLLGGAAAVALWLIRSKPKKNPSPYAKRKAKKSRHVRRKRRRRAGKGRLWMQGAVKKPGALRAWVQRTYGRAGFDSQGRIKMSVLQAHRHDPGTTGKRVRLALTFRHAH